jgi:hypothetical protein
MSGYNPRSWAGKREISSRKLVQISSQDCTNTRHAFPNAQRVFYVCNVPNCISAHTHYERQLNGLRANGADEFETNLKNQRLNSGRLYGMELSRRNLLHAADQGR